MRNSPDGISIAEKKIIKSSIVPKSAFHILSIFLVRRTLGRQGAVFMVGARSLIT